MNSAYKSKIRSWIFWSVSGSLLVVFTACELGARGISSIDDLTVELHAEDVQIFEGLTEVISLEDESAFRFAGDDGGPESPLFRVTDIVPRDDGGVFLTNAGALEVISLTGDGRVEWVVGHAGDGPGEFNRLSGLQPWRGDSVVAIDSRLSRATYISRYGEVGRTVAVPPPVADASPDLGMLLPGVLIGVLEDGRLAFRGPETARRLGEPGLRRVRTPLTLVDPEVNSHSTLLELPGPMMYELRTPGFMPVTTVPMTVGVSVDVGMDGIVWGRADSFEVFVIDGQGEVEQSIRLDQPLERVTRQMKDSYLEHWSPQFPVQEEIPFVTAEVPSFDRVFRSSSGNIWLRRHNPLAPYDDESRERWMSLSSDSPPVEYRFPVKVRILAASRAIVYGIALDSLDVERVVGFRID